ncbi:DUF305 domain-containing protein [Streptomyces sp. NPDC093225]|uniref:DUF305 domain-containing protein n=1 Tax=Streptomyces sp. NPDC093225 TaxID=3366034 RepID=UPI00382ACE68
MRMATDGTCRRLGLGLAAVALVLASTGCDDDASDRTEKAAPVVVAPGKPGEPNRRLTAEEAAKERPDDSPNSADFGYVDSMITHHRQALTMSALAPDRAASTPVKRLAERITAAQGPEIGAMERWLSFHAAGRPAGGHEHDHATMPGMATPEQLAALGAARGAAFDRLFLQLMTAHHRGALTMAGEALKSGNNGAVEEMATEVIAQQSAEIERMRSMG